MTDDNDPTKETATDEGLADQADELAKKKAGVSEDLPDPRNPEEWRDMPKEGGGA